jgi:hypothetical protein
MQMHQLYLVRPVSAYPDKRSAKVIELRVRREARKAARSPKLAPDRPRAA